MKLNLGCGTQVPDGWVNVDYALGARFAKLPLFARVNRKLRLFDLDWDPCIQLHDLTKRFPWEDGSAAAVYSSHTLEHLTRAQGQRFLGECHRVLRPSGVIRIVVPDLKQFVTDYIVGGFRGDEFVEKLGVLYGNSTSRLKNRLAPFIQFPHRCMYDTETLLAVLAEIGFDGAARGPFDSAIEDIERVELAVRTEKSVIVEGRKRAG